VEVRFVICELMHCFLFIAWVISSKSSVFLHFSKFIKKSLDTSVACGLEGMNLTQANIDNAQFTFELNLKKTSNRLKLILSQHSVEQSHRNRHKFCIFWVRGEGYCQDGSACLTAENESCAWCFQCHFYKNKSGILMDDQAS